MMCLSGDGLSAIKIGGDKIILRGTFLGITSKDFLVLKGLKGKVFNGVASKGSGMQLL